jgi:hypothetical protein
VIRRGGMALILTAEYSNCLLLKRFTQATVAAMTASSDRQKRDTGSAGATRGDVA